MSNRSGTKRAAAVSAPKDKGSFASTDNRSSTVSTKNNKNGLGDVQQRSVNRLYPYKGADLKQNTSSCSKSSFGGLRESSGQQHSVGPAPGGRDASTSSNMNTSSLVGTCGQQAAPTKVLNTRSPGKTFAFGAAQVTATKTQIHKK